MLRIRQNLTTAVLMTVVTTVLLGLGYPLLVTGLSQALFRDKANGQLIERNGQAIGSALIGQAFAAPRYFHGRPSAAGNGYDPTSSGGTNLGPTNRKLIDGVSAAAKAARAGNPAAACPEPCRGVPVDLVTSSASGLDPHISPAAALFQVPRVARERNLSEDDVRRLVAAHTESRQWGLLGESRVNVLLLNLALDDLAAQSSAKR